LLQFLRVRGQEGGATDLFRRWLSHSSTLNAATGAHVAVPDTNMAATTVVVEPRLHFRVGRQGWIRPGISFVRGPDARGFDAPLPTGQAAGVQVDIPVTF
jgi:hypothetical protein